jgi:hypothetical protein
MSDWEYRANDPVDTTSGRDRLERFSKGFNSRPNYYKLKLWLNKILGEGNLGNAKEEVVIDPGVVSGDGAEAQVGGAGPVDDGEVRRKAKEVWGEMGLSQRRQWGYTWDKFLELMLTSPESRDQAFKMYGGKSAGNYSLE